MRFYALGNITCTGAVVDFGWAPLPRAPPRPTPHAQTSPDLVKAYEAEFEVEICTTVPGMPPTGVGPKYCRPNGSPRPKDHPQL